MTDWGKTNRVDSYRFTVADLFTLEDIGEIEVDAESSSITEGYYTDNEVQASLALKEDIGANCLVRVYHRVQCDDVDFEYERGTFFIDDIEEASIYGDSTFDASCYSTLWRFTQDKLLDDFSRGKGYPVWKDIYDLVTARGGKLVVADGVDTERKHTTSFVFEIGETVSTVMSTIAGWLGCTISVTSHGAILLKPYTNPREMEPSYVFEEGENCTYVAGFEKRNSDTEKCNIVKVYYTSSSGGRSAIARLPQTDPFSYESIGRYVPHVEKLEDRVSQSELQKKADRILAEKSGSIVYIEIEAAWNPSIRQGAVVRYVNSTDSKRMVDVDALITEVSCESLSPYCMCKLKLKVERWN